MNRIEQLQYLNRLLPAEMPEYKPQKRKKILPIEICFAANKKASL